MFSKRTIILLSVSLFIQVIAAFAHDQTSQPAGTQKDSLMSQPISVIDLPQTDTNYVSVIKPPRSLKIRSGFVTLTPGASGEEHSTEVYEEMIVILSGQALMHSQTGNKSVSPGQVAYVPPYTKHFIENNGATTLKYLYIVTKTE
jgi:mannose-6-phosphate isomerase-like protein (cupin superfamily)